MKREPPLVKALPRQPGTKETRYAHLLSGEVAHVDFRRKEEPDAGGSSFDGERVAKLEEEIAALRNEIADVKEQFAVFRKQFE